MSYCFQRELFVVITLILSLIIISWSSCELSVTIFQASQAERLQVDTDKIKKKKGKTKSLLPFSEKVCFTDIYLKMDIFVFFIFFKLCRVSKNLHFYFCH